MSLLQYIYIGELIYRFSTLEPVIKYISNMGGNGSPYPYASTKSHTYLMVENSYIDFDPKDHDPYDTDKNQYKITGIKILQKRNHPIFMKKSDIKKC